MEEKRIFHLLEYVNNHCSYYSDLFLRNDINIKNADSFESIPLLTKALVQENEKSLLSDQYIMNNLIKEKTSGSTGVPLNCYYDRHERVRRSLILWKVRKNHCIDIMGKRMISFHSGNRNHGNIIKNSDDINIDQGSNIAYLNYLDLNDEKVNKYYTFIKNYKPYFIRCQPSVLQNFITFCNSNNLPLIDFNISLIEFTGEYLFSNILEQVQNTFINARICNHYGAQEFFCIAYSCKNQKLHLVDNQLIVEILNKDTEGFGDIVITSLSNLTMPFLRYKLGDIGKLSECDCDCNQFHSPVLELRSSRISDFFYIDNKKIHGHIFKNIIEKYNSIMNELVIKQFQIIQKTKNRFDILLVITNELNKIEPIENHIQRELLEILGKSIQIKVFKKEYLDINKHSGKLKVYNFL